MVYVVVTACARCRGWSSHGKQEVEGKDHEVADDMGEEVLLPGAADMEGAADMVEAAGIGAAGEGATRPFQRPKSPSSTKFVVCGLSLRK